MKKILYSIYSKIIVIIIMIVCLLQSLNIGLSALKSWDDFKAEVYGFENEFIDNY